MHAVDHTHRRPVHEKRIEGAIRLREQPDMFRVLTSFARRERGREVADGDDLPGQVAQIRHVGKAGGEYAIGVGCGVK